MNVEYHKYWSSHLNQDMELKVYGDRGKPVVVFPTQEGRFYQYEDFGMVEACRPFIDAGQVRLYTLDSVDGQSWANWNLSPYDRAKRHEQYDQYVAHEAVPFIHEHSGWQDRFIVTGCSMGAYHAGNFFFRYPNLFDTTIAISGLFRLNMFIGDFLEGEAYFHTPLAYLPNLNDPWYLEKYRRSKIIVVVGQGAWEDPMLEDAYALQRILQSKEVPVWIDIWGHDVNHDWPWWRKIMPYHLEKLELQVA